MTSTIRKSYPCNLSIVNSPKNVAIYKIRINKKILLTKIVQILKQIRIWLSKSIIERSILDNFLLDSHIQIKMEQFYL